MLLTFAAAMLCVLAPSVDAACPETPADCYASCGEGCKQTIDCEGATVQATLDEAADGDTIRVQAGSCTWTAAVTLPADRSIVLAGAGADGTTITASGNALISCPDMPGRTFRITGLTLVGPAGDSMPSSYLINTTTSKAHCAAFRIDSNIFRDCEEGRDGGCIQTRGACYGVIDHNQFIGTGVSKMAVDMNDDDNTTEDAISWGGPLDLGGSTAVYIEDNYFEIAYNARYLVDGSEHNWLCVDTNAGARYAVRYNVFHNCYVGAHGTCYQSGHGSLKHEIYGNWVYHDVGYGCPGPYPSDSCDLYTTVALLSGTGIIANNVFEGEIHNGNRYVAFGNNRSDSADCVSPWNNLCDGSSSLDENRSPLETYEGYACLDQPGLGTGQASFPYYIWGNHGCAGSVTTPTADCRTSPRQCYEEAYANCTVEVSSIEKDGARFGSKHFIENRDYFLSSHPTWTAYAYPHPLVSGEPDVVEAPDAAEDGEAPEDAADGTVSDDHDVVAPDGGSDPGEENGEGASGCGCRMAV
jgi:hypothetical protein